MKFKIFITNMNLEITENLFNFWLVVSIYLWIKFSEIDKV